MPDRQRDDCAVLLSLTRPRHPAPSIGGGCRPFAVLKCEARRAWRFARVTDVCVAAAGGLRLEGGKTLGVGEFDVRRRAVLSLLGLAVVGLAGRPAMAFTSPDDDTDLPRRPPKKKATGKKPAKAGKKQAAAKNKIKYKGREVVDFDTSEKPGTIIVRTRERALYQVLPDGRAMRYLVAVGKEGFSWSGVARIGMKRKNPTWTPPAEMIRRTPKYAKWRNGMPGGIPENPLGARALYLFDKGGDTMYRIHGTNSPSSIGTAASSGCIRMLNKEVVELFDSTPVGTKVIVQ